MGYIKYFSDVYTSQFPSPSYNFSLGSIIITVKSNSSTILCLYPDDWMWLDNSMTTLTVLLNLSWWASSRPPMQFGKLAYHCTLESQIFLLNWIMRRVCKIANYQSWGLDDNYDSYIRIISEEGTKLQNFQICIDDSNVQSILRKNYSFSPTKINVNRWTSIYSFTVFLPKFLHLFP